MQALSKLYLKNNKLIQLDGSELPTSLTRLYVSNNPSLTMLSNMDVLNNLRDIDFTDCEVNVQASSVMEQFSRMNYQSAHGSELHVCGNLGAPKYCYYKQTMPMSFVGVSSRTNRREFINDVVFSDWLACVNATEVVRNS